jgi:hypothetical protein
MGAEAPDKRPDKPPAKRPEKHPAPRAGARERPLTVQEEELISDSSSSEEGSTWWDEDDEARSAADAAPEPHENHPASEVGGTGFLAASKYGRNVPQDLSDDLGGSTASAVTERLEWLDPLERERIAEPESFAWWRPPEGAAFRVDRDGSWLAWLDELEREREPAVPPANARRTK